MSAVDITTNNFNTAAFKSQLDRLNEVSEDIASTKFRPNADASAPVTQQTQEMEQPIRSENPPQEFSPKIPTATSSNSDPVGDLAENMVELRRTANNVKAIAKVMSTADEMLGTVIDIRA